MLFRKYKHQNKKNTLKGIGIWILAISITLSSTFGFLTIALSAFAEESETLYSENFDSVSAGSLSAAGWNIGDNIVIDNKKALLNNNSYSSAYLSNKSGSSSWTDYTYSADVTLTDTGLPTTSNLAVAAIVAAVDSTKKGLEFGLCYNKPTSEYYVRLYDRVNKKQIDKKTVSFNLNEKQSLKIEISKKTMTCFLNGVNVISYNSTTDIVGTIGFLTSANVSSFDNILVVKTVKEPEIPEVISYSEDFSSITNDGLFEAGWNNGKTVTLNDGKMILDNNVTNNYMSGIEKNYKWKNYTYSADVTLTSTELTSTNNLAVAAIVYGANTSNKGYEFGLCYNKPTNEYYVRLYDRVNKKSLGQSPCDFKLDETVKLKIVFYENKMKCYVNSYKAFTCSFTNDIEGTIGVITNGNVAYFDNINVVSSTATSDEDLISFYEPFTSNSSTVKSRGWDKELTLKDQTAVLNSTVSNSYLTGNADAKNWKNYSFSADVILSDTSMNGEKQTGIAFAAIVAATTGTSNGFEYAICYNYSDNTGYLRLYDRTNKKILSYTTDGSVQLNKKYNLKIELGKDYIICYLDDKIVLAQNMDAQPVGSIGLRAGVNEAIYDNLVVVSNVKSEDDRNLSAELEENFDEIKPLIALSGWEDVSKLTIENETAVLNSSNTTLFLSKRENALNWSNYTYEAQVALTDDFISDASVKVAAIVAGADSSNKGYEFGLCYSTETNNFFLRLFNRKTGKQVGGNVVYLYSFGKNVILKIALQKNTIHCFADDVEVITETIGAEDITGTVGFRTAGAISKFDNIKVYATDEPGEQDPKDSTPDFYEPFDDLWSTTLNGWVNTAKLAINDGKALLDENTTILFLSKDSNKFNWKNYTVESEVILTDKYISDTPIKVAALVAGADSSKAGYEFGLCYNTSSGNFYVRLFNRKTGKQIGKNIACTYSFGDVAYLKVSLSNNIIKCYLDDNLIITQTIGTEPISGTIGMRIAGTEAYFDNIKVSQTVNDSSNLLPDIRNNNLWFFDDFSKFNSLTDRGWLNESDILRERMLLGGKSNTNYLSNIEKANEWTDYCASADVRVCMSDEQISNTVSSAALVVRSSGPKDGYEFSELISNKTGVGGYRLYDRKTGTVLAENSDVVSNADEISNLKVSVKGNNIKCYVNDSILFDVVDTNNSNPTGTIGLRNTGYSADFDNVAVGNSFIASPKTSTYCDYTKLIIGIVGIVFSLGLFGIFAYKMLRKHG